MARGRRAAPARFGPGVWACLGSAVTVPLALLALWGTPGAAGNVTPAPARSGGEASETRQSEGRAVGLPAPSGTPRASGRAVSAVVVERGDGRPVVVRGTSARSGPGPRQRYRVEVEGGLGVDAVGFARSVEAILRDPRSWGAGGRLSFQRVDSGPVAFRVVLASPVTTDRLCAPLRTGGTYSCANGGAAVLNLTRWRRGAQAYRGDLVGYRQYVVNHEVGHTLGHRHERCPGAGRPAPVMVQQTKGVGACRPNPWPFPA